MMAEKTLEETETVLCQQASNRREWNLFTEDPVWQRRLESFGIEPDAELHGGGRTYTLRADQVVIRKGKRETSEAQRAAFAERMAAVRANAE